MKTVYIAALAVSLAACNTAPNAPVEDSMSFAPITDTATFNKQIADRRLEFPDNPEIWFELKSNGTMTGELKGGTVTGTWEFSDGFWCREFKAGGTARPRDCQTVERAGNQVRFTRNRGAGDAGVYLMK
ncbi:MAG: hypothetical protein AAGK92_15385 [Pseudomonadota bacterium]